MAPEDSSPILPADTRRVGREQIEDWVRKLTTPGKQTVGDNYNVLCPFCGRNNTGIVDRLQIPRDAALTIEDKCHHCDQTIFYVAQWAIKVTAKAPGLTG